MNNVLTRDHQPRLNDVDAAPAVLPSSYGSPRMNHATGVLALVDRQVIQTMSFEFDGDRIRAIYIVRNREKLKRLN